MILSSCVCVFIGPFLLFFFFFFTVPGLSCSMWDLVAQPGIKPRPPSLGAQRLSHRGSPCHYVFLRTLGWLLGIGDLTPASIDNLVWIPACNYVSESWFLTHVFTVIPMWKLKHLPISHLPAGGQDLFSFMPFLIQVLSWYNPNTKTFTLEGTHKTNENLSYQASIFIHFKMRG